MYMAEQQMAWEKQSDDRQWKIPEGDDPRTLYQMLMTSVGRFGELDCFGYIPEKGMEMYLVNWQLQLVSN